MSIEDLKDMLQNNSYSQMISKIQYYAKQISGTNSYWYQVKEQLKATLNQVGPPAIFWTLSCAEFHRPQFHEMFGSPMSGTEFRKNVAEYPHILDWFFHERTEKFIKHWLYNILGADWHWNRYEFTQDMSIHNHGLAKLKSEPRSL